jgi:hypothetical protein
VEPRGLSSRLTMLLYPLTRRSPDHALGALPRYFTVEEIAEERDVIRVLVTRCIEQLRTQDRREKEVNVLSTDNR